MKQRISFEGKDVTTSTSAAWTTLLTIPTSTSKAMPDASSGIISYRVSFWLSGYSEGGIETGLVRVRNNAGTILIAGKGGSPSTDPFQRVQTGGIYPSTSPEIDWTVSGTNIILQVKCAQKDVSAYPGYNIYDFVSYGGSYYVCILTHATPHTPPNATYWTAITDRGLYSENRSYSTNDFILWDGSGNYWFATANISSGNNNPAHNSNWYAMNQRGPWDAGTGGLADLPTDFFAEAWWIRRHDD